MFFQIVHISGTTVYCICAILLWWISRVPRTNPGAGWWAGAILAAAVSRALLFALDGAGDPRTVLFAYGLFSGLEKTLLALGIVRFLKLPAGERWVRTAAGLFGGGLVLAWLSPALPLWTLRAALAGFNLGMLAFVAIACLRHCPTDTGPWLRVAAFFSGLLALHWATAFPLIEAFPGWRVTGLALGTVLVLVQYLALLACVLRQFQQRLMDAESKALDLAYFDPLTGLNNKNYLSKLFEQALVLATRPHHLVAVCYIDLDNFKPINDSAGHKAGDMVLQEVAQRLKSCIRSTDISARIGGDEFVVVATQLEQPDQVERIASKLLERLSEDIHIGGATYPLGASIGISLYPQHGDTLSSLIDAADTAMYQVKSTHKNGYALYDQSEPPERAAAG
ncbi:MAG: GGDEF domain-containing protein [Castellaniella sp.]|uniref:diguanylate cyclase domain-containing protein n=1 Tax=Castellaniella sp. TaxID=1955812 RepID=UPI003C748508